VLEEQNALEMLNVFMEELENGNTTQYIEGFVKLMRFGRKGALLLTLRY
jgi:hypothetical protein